MTDKASIRRSRRSKQIASAYELRQSGDWVYCIKRGTTQHHWHKPGSRNIQSGKIEPESSCEFNLDELHVMIVEYTGDEDSVVIPDQIDELPVLELHNKVFFENRAIKCVTMPDCILDIGLKVFGRCPRLENVRFSDSIAQLDASTFTGTGSLKNVHLPRQLESLDCMLLSKQNLELLEIPVGVSHIDWGQGNYNIASRVKVDEENAFFSSDGIAVYSKDGKELIRAIADTGEFKVRDTCRVIAKNAFKNMCNLKSVTLPSGLEKIGSYAFFNTGIEFLDLPSSFREIDNYAFCMCEKLTTVVFNEGLERIGRSAFHKSALESAALPASLRMLELDAFTQTRIAVGDTSHFCIDKASKFLFTDCNALYAKHEDGMTLIRYLAQSSEYRIHPACISVGEGSFAKCTTLETVEFPEGVRAIEAHAFEGCVNLRNARLPHALERIGDAAFSSTALETIEIAASLASIGNRALCVGYAEGGCAGETLRSVAVDPNNEHFYCEESILIERTSKGDRAVICYGKHDRVRIPKQVRFVSDFCFAATGLKLLELHEGFVSAAPNAFHNLSGLEKVKITFQRPIDGFDEASILFPGNDASAEGAARSLGLDVDGRFFRFAEYDSWIIHYWLLHKRNSVQVARMIFSRFDAPIKLSARARGDFERTIKAIMTPLCRESIRRRDISLIEKLIAYGFIDAGNIDSILHRSELEGASETTAYLLDVKQRRFGVNRLDFSL